jgi:hypothetical protein
MSSTTVSFRLLASSETVKPISLFMISTEFGSEAAHE